MEYDFYFCPSQALHLKVDQVLLKDANNVEVARVPVILPKLGWVLRGKFFGSVTVKGAFDLHAKNQLSS